tara:strand:+ start:626 stop:1018 length:393 start_codon:yes stop_codon:yes gene_type:complete
MLVRRTAFIARLYVDDDDPTIAVDKTLYTVAINGSVTLGASITAPVVGLGSGGIEDSDVVWEIKPSGGSWATVTEDSDHVVSTFDTATGRTTFRITNLDSADISSEYQIKVTGGITTPKYSSLMVLDLGT